MFRKFIGGLLHTRLWNPVIVQADPISPSLAAIRRLLAPWTWRPCGAGSASCRPATDIFPCHQVECPLLALFPIGKSQKARGKVQSPFQSPHCNPAINQWFVCFLCCLVRIKSKDQKVFIQKDKGEEDSSRLVLGFCPWHFVTEMFTQGVVINHRPWSPGSLRSGRDSLCTSVFSSV